MLTEIPNLVVKHSQPPAGTLSQSTVTQPLMYKTDTSLERTPRVASFLFLLLLVDSVRACLHGVGDPGLVGLVSFVLTLWGTQNKRDLPH